MNDNELYESNLNSQHGGRAERQGEPLGNNKPVTDHGRDLNCTTYLVTAFMLGSTPSRLLLHTHVEAACQHDALMLGAEGALDNALDIARRRPGPNADITLRVVIREMPDAVDDDLEGDDIPVQL